MPGIRKQIEKADQSHKNYEKTLLTDEDKQFYAEWTDGYNKFKDKIDVLLGLTSARKYNDVKNYIENTLTPTTKNLGEIVEEQIAFNIKSCETFSAENTKIGNATIQMITWLLIIGFIILIVIALLVSYDIHNVLKKLMAEITNLTDAAIKGRLNTRARVDAFNFEFQPVIIGINKTLDALIAPLNVAANYVDRISKGDIPPKITDTYNGDFNTIKDNLNQCIDGLEGLVEATKVLQKMSVNDYSSKVEGKYQGIYLQTATAVNLVIDRIFHVTDVIKNISCGECRDLEDVRKMGKRCDKDIFVPSMLFLALTEYCQSKMMAQGDLSVELKMRIGKGRTDQSII